MTLLQFAKQHLLTKYKNNKSSYKTAYSTIHSFLKRNSQFTDLLTDGGKILDTILTSKKSKETKRKLLFVFAFLLEKLNETKLHRKYIQAYTKIKYEIINDRKINKARSVKEAECLNISLQKLRSVKINIDELNQRTLLYNILIYLDPTPRLELRKLVYSPKQNIPEKNYIVCESGKCEIVLNDYKTSKYYKEWRIELEGDLKNYVENYIEKMKLNRGDNFFLNTRKKPYPSNKFSELIQKIFKDKIGVSISINCLRKIKERDLFHQNPKILNMSLKDREEYVKKNFRHNLHTSMLYYNRVGENNTEKTKTKSESENQQKQELETSDQSDISSASTQSVEKNIFDFMKDLNILTKTYGIDREQLKRIL